MAKSYRRKWLHKQRIIRQRGATYQVEINTNGERYRETAPTLDRAKQLIDQKLTELRNEGNAALLRVPICAAVGRCHWSQGESRRLDPVGKA